MAKGFIRGSLVGGAVSVIGLSALSILSGLPDTADRSLPSEQTAALPQDKAAPEAAPAPSAPPASASVDGTNVDSAPDTATPPTTAEVDVPAGSVFNAAREDGQAVLPQGDAAPQIATAPTLDSATAPANPPLSILGRDPAAQPQADQGGGSLSAPPDAGDAPAITPSVAGSTPRSATPAEPTAPASRAEATAPAISTDPAQPDQAQAAVDQDTPDRPSPAEEETGMAALAPMPQPQPMPRRQPLPVIEPAPPAVTPEQAAPDAPVAVQETAPLVRPAIGTPATSLIDRPAPGSGGNSETLSAENDIPLRRNALRFEDPEGRPPLAIVLIDRGDTVIGVEALRDFPYPLTFAVDAARPDAAEASASYRAAGFEVMALVDLAPDSTPQDAEVAMEVSLAAVPDAVAVLEGDATGFQTSRTVSEQVSAILGQRGYGLVMLPNGLNTAQRQAARDGVPSATVFRDFDGAGQDAAAIRRFLDQGAFKAGQQAGGLQATDGEGVIMMGRLRPDTISALLLWGLQDRAQRVALAPVSAVLDPAD